jgi:hypothetical protein
MPYAPRFYLLRFLDAMCAADGPRGRSGTEEVTQFIVASTEPVRRSWALEPTHRLVSTFDATVILLQSIVQVAAGAVLHAFT